MTKEGTLLEKMFETEIKISLFLTLVFWLVFFWLCFYWSRMAYEEKKINFTSAAFVSFYYSVIFFLVSLGILIFFSLIKSVLPSFLKF